MILRTLVAVLLVAAPVSAEVVRIEVKSRTPVLSGQAFGATGPYERLAGTIYFAIDPRNSANLIIADIDKAPRNAAGKVEFSSDFYLLKPVDASRGNGTVLYEVSNRGGKGMVGFFNFAAGGVDPQTAEQFGDGFLLEHGFSLLWVGWQFDVPMRDGLVRVFAPIAKEADGRAITGLVRSDFVVIERATEASLADRNHQAYPVSDRTDAATAMTVRDSVEGARRTIPRTAVAIHRGRQERPHDGRIRAEEDLRGGVSSAGSAAGRRRAGRRARHDLEDQIQRRRGARPRARRDQARHRVRHFAERPLSPHLSLLRVQRRRVAPQGV